MEIIATIEPTTLPEMIERLLLVFGGVNILGGLGWMAVGNRVISVDEEVGEMMERISLRAMMVGGGLVLGAGVWSVVREMCF